MEDVIEQDGVFVFRTSHRIVYNTKQPVPIKEVILALQGLDGLLRAVPKLVEGFTGVEIERGEFHIQSLESGSLIEDIAVAFFFKDKAGLDAFVTKMGANKAVKATVITAIIAALVAYGLHLATAKNPAPNITATNNVIINIGAGEVGMTPEAFTAVVKSAVGDKKGVAENALKFIGPARADPGSSVTLDSAVQGQQASVPIEISSAAIAEAPKRIELASNERVEEYKSAKLYIRATNLDSKKIGWAGKLANRDDRLPIELDPAVSEADIFGRTEVVVDAALVFKEKGKSRELSPARIYVRKVIKDVLASR